MNKREASPRRLREIGPPSSNSTAAEKIVKAVGDKNSRRAQKPEEILLPLGIRQFLSMLSSRSFVPIPFRVEFKVFRGRETSVPMLPPLDPKVNS